MADNTMTDENTGSYQLLDGAPPKKTIKNIALDVALHFASRKLLVAIASVFLVIEGVVRVSKLGLESQVLMVVLPFIITAVTVVCVTYLTGQAKIDVQASINGPKT